MFHCRIGQLVFGLQLFQMYRYNGEAVCEAFVVGGGVPFVANAFEGLIKVGVEWGGWG